MEEEGGPLDGYCKTFFSKALELSLFPQKPHKKGPDECFSARGFRHFEIPYRGDGKKLNKIILDECSTVVEIDHVRNRKTA